MIRIPRGTHDALPSQTHVLQHMEAAMRSVAHAAGYREIRTPTFEHTELFQRGVGDTTDVVQKEMYTFEDKGGRSITLKPEGTAGVVRSYIENGMASEPSPLKLYYINSPVFRYEAPQAGRVREHHQFGMEVFGAAQPSADAELILSVVTLYEKLGLKDYKLCVNSIGCPDCRAAYKETLLAYLKPKLPRLCETCNERYTRNPMRILDCKVEGCKRETVDAPAMLDALCEDCAAHFAQLKRHLDALGIPYEVDARIVRGLDYYTRTVFEFITETEDGELTLCGGGRYDGLVELLGGPATPAIGFGMGAERLSMALERQGAAPAPGPLLDAILITQGDAARAAALPLVGVLRQAGLRADCDHMGRSMKAQFKYADKTGARFALIMGDDEIKTGAVKVRDMTVGEEEMVSVNEVVVKLAEAMVAGNR